MKACGPPDARGVGRAFAIVVRVSSRKPRRGWRTHLLRNRFRRFGGMVIRDENDGPNCMWGRFRWPLLDKSGKRLPQRV